MQDNEIGQMLADGWTVAGYSTVVLSLGPMTHSILLQKGPELVVYNINYAGERERSRWENTLSIKP